VQFALNVDQLLLQEAIDAFVQQRYGANQRRDYRAHPQRYSPENWRHLADLGVLRLPFAAEDGGLGGGPRELITIMESLGRGLCVEPVLEQLVIAGTLLAQAGGQAEKATWLPRLATGEAHLALAHFEHAARFQLEDVNSKARWGPGNAWLLDGEKALVPQAAVADQFIVSAREEGADGAAVALYLVDPSTAGIERRDFHLADGSIASAMSFRAVRARTRLPGGLAELRSVADGARLAAGGEMLGIMTRLFDATVEYLQTRRQFGHPLSHFQALQHRLADLYVRLEQSRSHLYRAAGCLESRRGAECAIAGMKSYVSRAAVELGEECVHLHGGIGTTDELAIGHGYKRLLVLANLFGDANSELLRFNELRCAEAAARARQ
jgi:alkylation response protein AidB-like acyl-CoA dehydrogenase